MYSGFNRFAVALCVVWLIAATTLANAAQDTAQRDLDYQLLKAAAHGETWDVGAFLAKGANIEVRDGRHGFTPLMYAAANGHVGAVRHLLAKGAKVNAQTSHPEQPPELRWRGRARVQQTQIEEQSRSRDQVLYRYWVRYRQGGFILHNHGITALMLASIQGYNLAARELLRRGANPNLQTVSGDTALSCAAYAGYLPTVRALLSRGARLETGDLFGATPLAAAVMEEHTPVVRALLKAGASPNVQWQGVPLLRLSQFLGNDDISSALKKAGATGKVTQPKPQQIKPPTKFKLVTDPQQFRLVPARRLPSPAGDVQVLDESEGSLEVLQSNNTLQLLP